MVRLTSAHVNNTLIAAIAVSYEIYCLLIEKLITNNLHVVGHWTIWLCCRLFPFVRCSFDSNLCFYFFCGGINAGVNPTECVIQYAAKMYKEWSVFNQPIKYIKYILFMLATSQITSSVYISLFVSVGISTFAINGNRI